MAAPTPQPFQNLEEPAQLHLIPSEERPPKTCTPLGLQPPPLLITAIVTVTIVMDGHVSHAVTAHPRAQRQPSRRDRMEPFLYGTITGPSATTTTLPLLLYKTGLSPLGQLLELMAQSSENLAVAPLMSDRAAMVNSITLAPAQIKQMSIG